MKQIHFAILSVAALLAAIGCTQSTIRGEAHGVEGGPKYAVDPFWPKPLKGNQIIGQIAGLHVDSRDHVWILHRPNTLLADEKLSKGDPASPRCCVAAPAVLEFDPQGNMVREIGRASCRERV